MGCSRWVVDGEHDADCMQRDDDGVNINDDREEARDRRSELCSGDDRSVPRRVCVLLRGLQRQSVVALRNAPKPGDQTGEFPIEIDALLLVEHRHRLDVPSVERRAHLVLQSVMLVVKDADDVESLRVLAREHLPELVVPRLPVLPQRDRDHDDHQAVPPCEKDALARLLRDERHVEVRLRGAADDGPVVGRMCELERPVLARSLFSLKKRPASVVRQDVEVRQEDGDACVRHVERRNGLVEWRVGCRELFECVQLVPQRREGADEVVGDVVADERVRLEEVELELHDVVSLWC